MELALLKSDRRTGTLGESDLCPAVGCARCLADATSSYDATRCSWPGRQLTSTLFPTQPALIDRFFGCFAAMRPTAMQPYEG